MTIEIGRNRREREVRNVLKKFGAGYVSAAQDNGQTITAGGGTDVITWDTTDSNVDGWMNTTTGVYIPKLPGIYLVIATTQSTADRSNQVANMFLYKNGAEEHHLDQTKNERILQGSAMVLLDGVSDYIDIRVGCGTIDYVTTGEVTDNFIHIIYVGFLRS